MTPGGAICVVSFMIVTGFALMAVIAQDNIYDFMQSIWCPIFVVCYIVIFVFYKIGKRMADKYE